MDPEQVKRVAYLLTAGAGGLALVTVLPMLFGGRRRVAAALQGGMVAAVGGGLLLAVAGLIGMRLESGSGLRGCALAVGLGALLAPLATLIGTLGSDVDDRADTPPAASWALIPGIFLLGAGLFEMGWFARQYGIAALVQQQYWTLGVTLGLTWSALVLRATRGWPGAEALSGNVSGAALVAVALGWALQLAVYHYTAPSTVPWFVIFCGVGIMAGWTLSLVSAALSPGGRGSRAATIGSAIVMTLSVSAVAGSAQMHIAGRDQNLLPSMAAGYLAAILLFTLVIGNDERSGQPRWPDSLSATASVLGLAAVAWVGFKLMLGLGTAIACVGFLAAWPCATTIGVAAPSRLGMPVPQRFTTLAGASLALFAAFKVFQEAGDLMLSGVDIADGNVMVSLVVGFGLAVVLESIFGRAAACEMAAPSLGRGLLDAGVRFVTVVLMCGVALLCVGLFAGVEGGAVVVLGLAMWALVAAAAMASTGEESGLVTFRSLPAALVTASAALVALPWKGLLLDVTREQKTQVVSGLVVCAVVGVVLSALLMRRKSDPAGSGPAVDEDNSNSTPGGPS